MHLAKFCLFSVICFIFSFVSQRLQKNLFQAGCCSCHYRSTDALILIKCIQHNKEELLNNYFRTNERIDSNQYLLYD